MYKCCNIYLTVVINSTGPLLHKEYTPENETRRLSTVHAFLTYYVYDVRYCKLETDVPVGWSLHER